MREHVERFWARALDSAFAPGLVAYDVYGVSWAIKPTNSLARFGRIVKLQNVQQKLPNGGHQRRFTNRRTRLQNAWLVLPRSKNQGARRRKPAGGPAGLVVVSLILLHQQLYWSLGWRRSAGGVRIKSSLLHGPLHQAVRIVVVFDAIGAELVRNLAIDVTPGWCRGSCPAGGRNLPGNRRLLFQCFGRSRSVQAAGSRAGHRTIVSSSIQRDGTRVFLG